MGYRVIDGKTFLLAILDGDVQAAVEHKRHQVNLTRAVVFNKLVP